jgi:hypothetical protein
MVQKRQASNHQSRRRYMSSNCHSPRRASTRASRNCPNHTTRRTRPWWLGLRREVTDYVKGCAECQRHKVNNRPTKAPLEPIWAKPEATLFETVAVDFITKLPVSQGYDSILTVTDHDCSKATIFIPCMEEISGEETAALYAKHVFARYGLPTKIISNRDLQFASKFT